MNVSLTSELEQIVNEKVSSGMYQTASEVVREGLRLLVDRDRHMEALRRDINAGFKAVERGEYTEYKNEADLKRLIEGVKSRGRKRLEEEQAKSRKK